MNKITRRAALASIPAMGTAAIVPAMSEPVDPMLAMITEYRKQVAAFAAIPDDVLTKDSEPGYVASTYEPAMLVLMNETPETTSIAGVREAIRLAFEENAFLCTLSEKCLRSALAYLDQEALI